MLARGISNAIFTSRRTLVLSSTKVIPNLPKDVDMSHYLPVVVMHGLLGSKLNFRTFSKSLYASEVINVDMRNHGHSEHSSDTSMESMAEDVVETMREHGHEKFIMLGHSLGGKVAMTLGLTHPEKLGGLVVLDMAPVDILKVDRATSREGYTTRHIIKTMAELESDAFLLSKKEFEHKLMEKMPKMSKGMVAFLMQNVVELPGGENCRLLPNVRVLADQYDDQLAPWNNPKNLHGSAEVPTLFLRGELSGFVSDHTAEHVIPSVFPGAQVEMITQAGHWLHADKPQECLKVINNFINENCAF